MYLVEELEIKKVCSANEMGNERTRRTLATRTSSVSSFYNSALIGATFSGLAS